MIIDRLVEQGFFIGSVPFRESDMADDYDDSNGVLSHRYHRNSSRSLGSTKIVVLEIL